MAEAEAVEIDERFEYDAPRFYDFDEGSPAGGAPADGWFDTDGPKGLTSPVKPPKEQQEPKAGAAAGAAENVDPQQQGDAGGKGGGSKGKEWRRALASITGNTTAAAVAKGQQGPSAAAQQQQKQGTKRRAAAGSAGEGAAAAAAAGAAGSSKSRPASATAKQSEQPQRAASRQGNAAAAAAAAAASSSPAAATRHVAFSKSQQQQQQPPHKQHRQPSATATDARSPRLHPRQRAAHPAGHKTSEQLELEQVEREKEAAAALRRRNAEAVKHVLGAPPPPVVHSSRPLTEPVPLELCTSKRRRLHSMETRSMSPFKSQVELIARFEGRLPSKSRLRDEGGSSAHQQQQQQHNHHHQAHGAALTVPQSPKFATKRRVRPARFKPREQVEEEEMAAMPKFKARPVDKRMLEGRSIHAGVPHVEAKRPTVPEPFAFKTDQRAAEHASSAAHSHHGPGSSSSAPSAGAGSAGAGGAFVFAAPGGEGGRVTRSKAASKKAGLVAVGWTGQLTHPEPFHLATDARGANKRVAAADPQQEVQQARASKRARRGASAGPFHLATDERGVAEQERLEGIRRQQEEQARREAEFKALPLNKAALAGAWKPPPAAHSSLTVPHEVALHSAARAEQRRAFDATVASKQAELEAERQQLQALQAAAEEEQVRANRKKLGHKALPLPDRL